MLRCLLAATILLASSSIAVADDPVSLDVPTAKKDWEQYVDQRIRLTGGHVSSVKTAYDLAVYGEWGKPTLPINTAGADAAMLATLEAACTDQNTSSKAECAYDVVATMTKNARDKPELKEPEFVKR